MAKIYSFKNKTVIFDGAQITGFAKGEGVVSFKYTKDRLTPDVGADGAGIMSISPDKSGILTLKLQASSPSNALLSAAYQSLDLPAQLVAQVLIKDSLDQTYLTGGFLVDNYQDYQEGEEAPSRVWRLVTLQAELFVGGLTPDVPPSSGG